MAKHHFRRTLDVEAYIVAGVQARPVLRYISFWFAAPDIGCLYDSRKNMNPITGMRISVGRTNPTFPGEKLRAAII